MNSPSETDVWDFGYDNRTVPDGATKMELPIPFPSDAEVIREEVARFRRLTQAERVGELNDAVRMYYFLREQSGRAEDIDRLAEEDERRGHEAVMAFAKKYG